ncbi:MFS transporter [Streptomyces diastatochromogenes]|nr:MFS transporter [Streptomyces diastatochromogenes]
MSTWLPQMMRASGYGLNSSVSFLLVINAGGIVGLLIAGRTADRFGAVRVSAIWFVLTAAGALLLKAHLPLGATYAVVAVTGVWLFSAQVMVYAATDTVYRGSERAAGLGWVTGVGRTGAVVGPWLIGALADSGNESWGFTTFALAGLVGAVAIALVPLARRIGRSGAPATVALAAGASPRRADVRPGTACSVSLTQCPHSTRSRHDVPAYPVTCRTPPAGPGRSRRGRGRPHSCGVATPPGPPRKQRSRRTSPRPPPSTQGSVPFPGPSPPDGLPPLGGEAYGGVGGAVAAVAAGPLHELEEDVADRLRVAVPELAAVLVPVVEDAEFAVRLPLALGKRVPRPQVVVVVGGYPQQVGARRTEAAHRRDDVVDGEGHVLSPVPASSVGLGARLRTSRGPSGGADRARLRKRP